MIRQCGPSQILIMPLLKHPILSIVRAFSSTRTEDVLFDVKNNIGIVTLNRPKALNSITASMATALYSKLSAWQTERSFVIVKGSGNKAFCSGGDIVLIAQNKSEGIRLFRNQYRTNYLVKMSKTPFVSLCDGITMGAGAGLSISGRYRIATERTVFAMPEAKIGLLTESSSTYFLPRLEGNLGLFLGLTGHRLNGIDVVKAGIATHFVPSDKIDDLFERLVEGGADSIEDVLKKNAKDLAKEKFSLSSKLDLINSCFDGQSVEKICEQLRNDGSQWSKNTLDVLMKGSPTSLKISKKAIDLGASSDFRDCLITEFRLVMNAIEKTISSDFYEGVRAAMIDKDDSPKWSPASLEEVKETDVDKCFAPSSLCEELGI